MKAVLRSSITVIGALIAILAIVWSGFMYPPKSLPPHPEETKSMRLVSIPSDLPKPVERHFGEVFDLKAPAIETAVVWGEADVRIWEIWDIWDIWAPALYKGYYSTSGHEFVREVQVTWFGKTILTGKDSHIRGRGFFEIAGRQETGEKIDSGQNLAFWTEAVFMPTIFITDPNIRWQAVDDTTAMLIIPYKSEEDTITVKFDPETGLMSEMRALRYRSQDPEKITWIVKFFDWREQRGIKVPSRVTVAWGDEDGPWARFKVGGIKYNVGVTPKIPKEVK